MIQEIGSLIIPSTGTIAGEIAAILVELGARTAFGVLGGSVAPLARALHETSLALVHTRHEAGAAFAAVEASLASGAPSLVFTTTGPGLTNALTGIVAARCEGARVIVISGTTARDRCGRFAFQETGPTPALVPSELFDFAITITSALDLATTVRELARGLARPHGFVAHLRVPLDVQTMLAASGRRPLIDRLEAGGCDDVATRVAEILARGPFAIWVGYGARHCAAQIRAIAERTGASVMTSPRAKGVFPEGHPQWLGVTGLGAHPVAERLRDHPQAHTLVLGTRLGELTSFWDPALVAAGALIHVDIDDGVFGRAYPDVPTLGVRAELGAFLDRLVPRLPPRRPLHSTPPSLARVALRAGAVRPAVLMQEVQTAIVERSDAIVIAEAGNAYAWATHALRFATPGRWRVSSGFGSMGQATAGVIGAALAGGRAVALVGDGAMLMNNEVSTAVAHGLRAAWIVLDDARYGMIEQGMRSLGWSPFATAIPRTDFAAMARAMGAGAIRVEHEHELPAALAHVATMDGPIVVDVVIDPDEPAPSSGRNRSLVSQLRTGAS